MSIKRSAKLGAGAGTRPETEKLCPISFDLSPTTLQAGFSRHIEKVNAKLAQDLVDLRGLMPFKNDEDAAALARKFEGAYQGTYLAFPVLWDDQGAPHTGWLEVLAYLATILPQATFIQPQAVRVELEYLPIGNRTEAFIKEKLAATMRKRGTTSLWFDYRSTDFLASIRTVLAYAPYDDPILLGNEDPNPHQHVCDPIF